MAGNLYSSLLALRQQGTVCEYKHQFEMLSSPLGLERRYLKGLFLSGLKEEVSAELELHSYNSIDDMMELAERIGN